MDLKVQQFLQTKLAAYPQLELADGQILYEPGEKIEEIYFLQQGLVKQYVISPKGEEVILHLYKQPALLPMMILLSGKNNIFYFETLDKVRVIKAPVDEVYDSLIQNPMLMFDLASRFAMAISGLSERIVSLTTAQQKQQLLQLLTYMAYNNSASPKDGWLMVPAITHSQISSWLGTARETVSRLLKQLEKDGSIQANNKSLWIKI